MFEAEESVSVDHQLASFIHSVSVAQNRAYCVVVAGAQSSFIEGKRTWLVGDRRSKGLEGSGGR